MSQENVEIVRRIYEGWRRGDFSVGGDVFAPDIRFGYQFGLDTADAQGATGIARVWADHLSNWASWQTGEIEDLRIVGDTVIVFNSVRGIGKRSGAAVEMPNGACLFEFRDGKITRLLAVGDRRLALEAVGLSE